MVPMSGLIPTSRRGFSVSEIEPGLYIPTEQVYSGEYQYFGRSSLLKKLAIHDASDTASAPPVQVPMRPEVVSQPIRPQSLQAGVVESGMVGPRIAPIVPSLPRGSIRAVNVGQAGIQQSRPQPEESGTDGGASAPPSVEKFRSDLLQAVSERTGYPEDMLDLELPLESGLGIDSIKTVEIYSNLKKYHTYFRRQGLNEDEALSEFTKFKTLEDIISSYELLFRAMVGDIVATNEGEDDKSKVERYTIEAVEAPASREKNWLKRN